MEGAVNVTNPFSEPNNIWAVLYLDKVGDDRNMIAFRSRTLEIIERGRRRGIPNGDILFTEKGRKKLLLPLISGGLLVPFGALALSQGLFNVNFLLVLLFFGIYLFYRGWSGTEVLLINVTNGQEMVFIPYLNPNLGPFVDFLNSYFSTEKEQEHPHLVFHFVMEKSASILPTAQIMKEGLRPKDGLDLVAGATLSRQKNELEVGSRIISISAEKLSSEIAIRKIENRTIFHVSEINPESIIEVKEVR